MAALAIKVSGLTCHRAMTALTSKRSGFTHHNAMILQYQTLRIPCTTSGRWRSLTFSRRRSAATRCSINEPEAGSRRRNRQQVPDNFGGRDGPPIANKATILADVDRAVAGAKAAHPPDVEVILTDHISNVTNPIITLLDVAFLRFGHVAVRYTTSDGNQRVFNIMGDLSSDEHNANMVNFVRPEDYIYGTGGFDTYSQQGGVYNRPFVGVRIERVARGATDAMHAYFQALDKATLVGHYPRDDELSNMNNGRPGSSDVGAARFQLIELQLSKVARHVPRSLETVFLRLAGWLRKQHVPVRVGGRRPSTNDLPEVVQQSLQDVQRSIQNVQHSVQGVREAAYDAGNCAQWSSSGLRFAGLLRRPRTFPKALLIELLEDEVFGGRPNNVNVVVYREVEHAARRNRNYRHLRPAFVHPLYLLRNAYYSNMEDFASAIVSVPPGSDVACVERRQPPTRRPRQWLRVVSGLSIGVPAAVLVGAVEHVGPMGPVAAAAWLGLNWWLY